MKERIKKLFLMLVFTELKTSHSMNSKNNKSIFKGMGGITLTSAAGILFATRPQNKNKNQELEQTRLEQERRQELEKSQKNVLPNFVPAHYVELEYYSFDKIVNKIEEYTNSPDNLEILSNTNLKISLIDQRLKDSS
jgi:hypothetical protein